MELIQQKRSQVVDVAKGIAILSVIVLHSWFCSNGTSYLSRWIGGFQLPLFFFIGGLFFKYENWGGILRSRIDSLLKPLFVVAFLWAPVGLTFGRHWNQRHLGVSLDLASSAIVYISAFLVGVPVFTQTWGLIQMHWGFGPTWFVVHLFGLHLFCVLLAKIVRWDNHKFVKSVVVVAGMLIVFYFQITLIPKIFHLSWSGMQTMGLPLHLDLVFLTGAFFLLGNLMADQVKNMKGSLLWAMVLTLFYSLMVRFFSTDFSLFWRSFANFPAILLIAGVGIWLGMQWSAILARIPGIARPLAFIGSRSLYILMFHTLFYFLTWSICEKIRIEKWIATCLAILVGGLGSLFVSEILYRIPLVARFMYPYRKPANSVN